MSTIPVAVLDADVIYGIEVTDVLLTMATRRVIRVHWSLEILDEMRRNLVQRPNVTAEAVAYRIERMGAALPDALAKPPPELVAGMPINAKDRHVLALAVHLEAEFVVTKNLQDFPSDLCGPYGVKPVGPDEFLVFVAETNLGTARSVVAEIAGRRMNPPQTITGLLDRLNHQLPNFVALLR